MMRRAAVRVCDGPRRPICQATVGVFPATPNFAELLGHVEATAALQARAQAAAAGGVGAGATADQLVVRRIGRCVHEFSERSYPTSFSSANDL